jgi:hypothetical protein
VPGFSTGVPTGGFGASDTDVDTRTSEGSLPPGTHQTNPSPCQANPSPIQINPSRKGQTAVDEDEDGSIGLIRPPPQEVAGSNNGTDSTQPKRGRERPLSSKNKPKDPNAAPKKPGVRGRPPGQDYTKPVNVRKRELRRAAEALERLVA